jgi:hypothetical protein
MYILAPGNHEVYVGRTEKGYLDEQQNPLSEFARKNKSSDGRSNHDRKKTYEPCQF